MKTLIPFLKREKYNDNDGAFDIVYFFDNENKTIESKKFDNYTRELTPEIETNFLKENEALIKNLLIDEIIKENQFINNCQFIEDGNYNVNALVKGSRKYKGKEAKLISLFSRLNQFSGKNEKMAKIEGLDGIIYFISASTVSISIETIKAMLNELDVYNLVTFNKNRNDFYCFNK